MSRLLPFTEEQAVEWRTRSPEPIVLELPGWRKEEHTPPQLPNLRLCVWEKAKARIELARHWDQPLLPGRPMVTAGARQVTIAGHAEELLRTSMFEGTAMEVDVLFLQGPGWSVRFVFDECPRDVIDGVCARIVIVP